MFLAALGTLKGFLRQSNRERLAYLSLDLRAPVNYVSRSIASRLSYLSHHHRDILEIGTGGRRRRAPRDRDIPEICRNRE